MTAAEVRQRIRLLEREKHQQHTMRVTGQAPHTLTTSPVAPMNPRLRIKQ